MARPAPLMPHENQPHGFVHHGLGRRADGIPPNVVPSRRIALGGRADGVVNGRSVLLRTVTLDDWSITVEFELWPAVPPDLDGLDYSAFLFPIVLSDDVGTEYTETSGGFMPTSDSEASLAHRKFVPCLAMDATWLRVGILGMDGGEALLEDVTV